MTSNTNSSASGASAAGWWPLKHRYQRWEAGKVYPQMGQNWQKISIF
jgi:hypothetical protein